MNQHIKLVLLISVALNALLIGIVFGGASFYFTEYFTAEPPKPQVSAIPSETQFSEEKRELYKTIMLPAWKEYETSRSAIFGEKQLALRLIKATPFNDKSYMKELQHIRDMHAQRNAKLADAVVQFAKQLTPEERVIFANIISHKTSTCKAPAAK